MDEWGECGEGEGEGVGVVLGRGGELGLWGEKMAEEQEQEI